jgi:hypothetical protein
MKRGGRHLMLLVLGLIFVAACTPSVPEQYIQPDDMEDILYDYHVSQGMAVKETGGTDYYRNLYFKAVLEKYGVTQEEFDSSLVYYYTRADKFISMYKNVQERLAEEALVRGASVSEVNRYTSTSLSGDTADIWEGQRTAVLMAQRPYHLMQFYQKADTSYHAGDSFLMTFNNTFLAQSSSRQTYLYMAVTYENDSTYSQQTTIGGQTTALRVPVCKLAVKDIRGYILMGARLDEREMKSNDVCLLFLDNIRLIRFHNKLPEEVVSPAVSAQEEQKQDTLKADSTQRRVRRLGERPQMVVPKKE